MVISPDNDSALAHRIGRYDRLVPLLVRCLNHTAAARSADR